MTTKDVRKSQFLSVVVIVSTLGLMYWLDTVTIFWRRQAHATFNMESFNLFSFTLPVVFAVLVIFLSWLLLVHFKPTWATLLFCLLVGVGLVGYPILFIIGRPILVVNSPALGLLRTVLFGLGTGSMTVQVGPFILLIGLINLTRTLVAATPKSL